MHMMEYIQIVQDQSLSLCQDIYTHLKHICDQQERIQNQVARQIEYETERRRRLELENQIESQGQLSKKIPWQVPKPNWDLEITVRIFVLEPARDSPHVFDAIKKGCPFETISTPRHLEMKLRCTTTPFGRGTFRSAYYAEDAKRCRQVLFLVYG